MLWGGTTRTDVNIQTTFVGRTNNTLHFQKTSSEQAHKLLCYDAFLVSPCFHGNYSLIDNTVLRCIVFGNTISHATDQATPSTGASILGHRELAGNLDDFVTLLELQGALLILHFSQASAWYVWCCLCCPQAASIVQ